MERARIPSLIGLESGRVKGGPEPAGSTGKLFDFSVDRGDISAMPNSA